MTMQTSVSIDHRKRMLRHLAKQELVQMAIEAVEVGTILYDNDPRRIGRKMVINDIGDSFACCYAEGSRRKVRIRLDRIYTDGKPRRRGFSTKPPVIPVRIPIGGGEGRAP